MSYDDGALGPLVSESIERRWDSGVYGVCGVSLLFNDSSHVKLELSGAYVSLLPR